MRRFEGFADAETVARYVTLTAVLGLSLLVSACRGRPGAQEHHELNLPPVGASVAVRLEGKTVNVDVAAVGADAGAASVPIVQLWSVAFPSEDPSRLHFDLVGSDGFRPMSRPKCTHLLGGDELAHFRLDVVKHDVSIADGLDLAGCYRVHAVVAIEATR